jgi:hypothetical protein
MKEGVVIADYTKYHCQYWANALTVEASAGSFEGLSRSIANARVDLNPHQVDAALFALRSPLSICKNQDSTPAQWRCSNVRLPAQLFLRLWKNLKNTYLLMQRILLATAGKYLPEVYCHFCDSGFQVFLNSFLCTIEVNSGRIKALISPVI